MPNIYRVLYYYAVEDQALAHDLDVCLAPLKQQGIISTWCPLDIAPGQVVATESQQRLRDADLILLLVSRHFMANCPDDIKVAFSRHRAGTSTVIPILLRPTCLEGAGFSALRILPSSGKAVTSYDDPEDAWYDIAQSLRQIVSVRVSPQFSTAEQPLQMYDALYPASVQTTITPDNKVYQHTFDVYLVYNVDDRSQVEAIAHELRERGLYPWFDSEQIAPGSSIQDELQRAIPQVRSAAVFVGPRGIGKWQALELKAFMRRCVESSIAVIPVLLPGVNHLPSDLVFLRELRLVNFGRDGHEQALQDLEWGITGIHPMRIPRSSIHP